MTQPVTPAIQNAQFRPPPLRPETIIRERLVRELDRAATAPLTVVCAQAGFGKTTAVAQWLASAEVPHSWISLNAGDNDPRRLAARLLTAVDHAFPDRLGIARRALEEGAAIEATVIPLLAETLTDPPVGRLAIVLDDYHLIDQAACHGIAMALIDSLPPTVTMLIATRERPPLRLERRRAAGALAEIGPDRLRFRPTESDLLLNGPLDLGLDHDQVALIDQRIDGWAAGLALVASVIAARPDHVNPLAALEASRESLEGYLSEEVLDTIDPELSTFLRRTSVVSELSAPLCEAVSGEPRAAELLEQARQMNLFLTSLDSEGEWLRFHDVFRTALRVALRRNEPGQIDELHRRAATWYEENDRPEEAMDHALLGGDGRHAGALLGAHWIVLIQERRYVTLRRTLDRFPAERGEFGPLCEALNMLCSLFEGVDQRVTVDRALSLATRHGDDPQVRLVLDGMLISPFYGNIAAALRAGDQAWERYAEQPSARDQLVGAYALTLWFAGENSRVRALLEPRVLLEQSTFQKVWTLAILALAITDDGETETGEHLAREAMAEVIAARAETATEFTALPWVLGQILIRRGKLREARDLIDRGIAGEESRPGSVGHTTALIFDSHLALAEGDRERALRSAARARRMVDGYPDLGTLPDRLAAVESALAGDGDHRLLGTDPTAAERRVLALLDSPRSLAEIAAELYISRETVKSHVRRLYRRLGVKNRKEAVAVARERDLLGAVFTEPRCL